MNTQKLIKELCESAVARQVIPMGYTPGLPLACLLNGYLCLKIPFLRYKVTGKVDATLVYAPRFVMTVKVPEGLIVGIEDLTFNPSFDGVDFSRPIGTFRHETIRHLNRTQYGEERAHLLGLYDELIDCLDGEKEFAPESDAELRRLASLLTEPCMKPFCRTIDKNFHDKYLTA